MVIRPGRKYRYYPGVAMAESSGGPGFINPHENDMSMRGCLVTVRARSNYNNNWWEVLVHRNKNVTMEMTMLICTECLLPVDNEYIAREPKNSP